MKKMIKVIAICSILLLAISMLPMYAFASNYELTTAIIPSLEEEFSEDVVLVTIKKEYSVVNRVWVESDFNVSNIASIEDMTSVSSDETDVFTGNLNFRQMLRVTLENSGKQEVIDAILSFASSQYVELAEPNYCVSVEWGSVESGVFAASTLDANGEVYPATAWDDLKYELSDIGADKAWAMTKGSRSVKVGVVDTGIALHEDLNDNVITGLDCVNNDTNTTDDILGHGTGVAGLIGAVGGNNKGITGVNWYVTMVPLQVSPEDSPSSVDIAAVSRSFLYAAANEIDVLNCSFTFPSNSSTITQLARSISLYDGVIVCAAGNTWSDIDDGSNAKLPICFQNDNIIGVGATCKYLAPNAVDVIEAPAFYSNMGVTSVDLYAPGGAGYGDTSSLTILTTASGVSDEAYENGYMFWSGTSFAAPLVAGSAALLLAYNPNLTAQEIRTILMATVDVPENGATAGLMFTQNICVTGGRLNVFSALQQTLPGNEVRNVVATVNVNDTSFTTNTNYPIRYDRGKYELVSVTAKEFEEGAVNILTPESGQIVLNYESEGAFVPSGRLILCKFISRHTLPVSEDDTYINNSTTALSTDIALLGDVNGDNSITSDDASCGMDVAFGETEGYDLLACDCDFNETYNTADVRLVLQKVNNNQNFW